MSGTIGIKGFYKAENDSGNIGQNAVTLSVKDINGNTGTCSAMITITYNN